MALFIGLIGAAQMAGGAWLAIFAAMGQTPPAASATAATLFGNGTIALAIAGAIVALRARP